MRQSLGFIEVAGLLSALTVADTMVKTANITLLDVKSANGGGWMTVIITGGVAAVIAAIDAGEKTAHQLNSFISKKVIPRPDEAVWKTFVPEQVGVPDEKNDKKLAQMKEEIPEEKPEEKAPEQEEEKPEEKVLEQEQQPEEMTLEQEEVEKSEQIEQTQKQSVKSMLHDEGLDQLVEELTYSEYPESAPEVHEESLISEVTQDGDQISTANEISCNLCLDPDCTRKKGELKINCIHYQAD